MLDLHEKLTLLGHPHVLVVGDLILDRYTWGNAERISPEAPVMVLHADREEARLGGAASVAFLLHALEATVSLAGVIGKDNSGQTIAAMCRDERIDIELVAVDANQSTTLKERFIGRAGNRHPQQMLRVDHEERRPIDPCTERRFLAALAERIDSFSIILISDYAKGFCSASLVSAVIDLARAKDIPVYIDPGRVADYRKYRRGTLLTPNRGETELATGRSIRGMSDAIAAAQDLQSRLEVPNVLVKLDREGMVLVQPDEPPQHFATRPREVYDVVGAGDMVLAMVGLCRAARLDWNETIQLANLAAGLEVEKQGVAAVYRKEIEAALVHKEKGPFEHKVVSLRQLLDGVSRHRRQGKTIVFTNGCFDLLHAGHVSYLQQAAHCGDVLVVGINSDASVRRLKGEHRPIVNQGDRTALLAALGCVDYAVIFDEDSPRDLIVQLRPDVLVKGGTYAPSDVVGHDVVESYGGRVVVTGKVDGISTTTIVEQIRAMAIAPTGATSMGQ